MKLKLKLKNGYGCELDFYEAYCNTPYVYNDSMIIYGQEIGVELSKNIWRQLPEDIKKKVYKNNFNRKIFNRYIYLKNIRISISKLSAYNINFFINEKKKSIGEVFENFKKNKYIMEFETNMIFPYKRLSILLQSEGDIFIEFDSCDIIYNVEEKIHKQNSINKIKKISNNEELYEIYTEIEKDNFLKTEINLQNFEELVDSQQKLEKEIAKRIENKPYEIENLRDELLLMKLLIEKAKELKADFSDKVKFEIKNWLLDILYTSDIEKVEIGIIENIINLLKISEFDRNIMKTLK